MARKTNATAFFRPEQDISFDHLSRDVLESHAGLHQFQAVRSTHLIYHRSCCERLHDPPLAFAVRNEMVQQQTNKLVRAEIIPTAVHASYTVGIAVRHQADVMGMFLQKGRAAGIILFDRFWIDPAEERVMFCVQRGYLAGCAGEELFETSGADAKKRFV